MNHSRPFKAITSFFTVVTFLTTSILWSPNGFAAAQSVREPVPSVISEVSIPYQARLDPGIRFSIPQELGTLQYFKPGKGPMIVHLQTAHGHYQAQKQIQALLHYLDSQYGITTLLVEGSAFKLQPEILNFFPEEPKLTQHVNDALTKAALVKGPELYLLDKLNEERDTGKKGSAPSAYGIENLEVYRENGLSFVDVLAQKQKTREFLAAMNQGIERCSAAYLNDALRNYLKQLESFEKSQIPLDTWLSSLKKEAQKRLKLDLTHRGAQLDWPMLVRVFKIQEISAAFHKDAFPAERDRFLNAIKQFLSAKGNRGTFLEIEELLKSDAISRQLPDPETSMLFEDMVKALPRDFNYEAFPNVRYFIGRLLLQSELKAPELMDEVQRLSGKITEKLSKTKAEKDLLALLKDYRLLQRLFALELTPGDYDLISGARVPGLEDPIRPSEIVKRFRQVGAGPERGTRTRNESLRANAVPRVRDISFSHISELDQLFDAAMKFYAGVKERDGLMERMIEQRLQETGAWKVAVITGGFHSDPFKNYFSSKDYTYALISPRITGSDEKGHEAYIQNMLHLTSGRSSMGEGMKQESGETSQAVKSTRESPFLSDPQVLSGVYGMNAAAVRSEVRRIITDIAGRAATLQPVARSLQGAIKALGSLVPERVPDIEETALFRSEVRLNAQEVKAAREVVDHLAMRSKNISADHVLIVLGNPRPEYPAAVVKVARELNSPKIVIVGKGQEETPEWQRIRDEMIQRDPSLKEKIVTSADDHSMNTGQNVEVAVKIIKNEGLPTDHIVITQRAPGMRLAQRIFEFQWQANAKKEGLPANPPAFYAFAPEGPRLETGRPLDEITLLYLEHCLGQMDRLRDWPAGPPPLIAVHKEDRPENILAAEAILRTALTRSEIRQIQGLSAEEIRKLSPAKIGSLSPRQIRALTQLQLLALTEKQSMAFTAVQLHALTGTQLHMLMGRDQERWLDARADELLAELTEGTLVSRAEARLTAEEQRIFDQAMKDVKVGWMDFFFPSELATPRRIAAVGRLGAIKNPSVTQTLRDLLGREENGDVWFEMASVLWRAGDPWGRRTVVSALQDESPFVRQMAAQLLGEQHETSAIAALTATLSDKDPKVREAASEAIEWITTTSSGMPPRSEVRKKGTFEFFGVNPLMGRTTLLVSYGLGFFLDMNFLAPLITPRSSYWKGAGVFLLSVAIMIPIYVLLAILGNRIAGTDRLGRLLGEKRTNGVNMQVAGGELTWKAWWATLGQWKETNRTLHRKFTDPETRGNIRQIIHALINRMVEQGLDTENILNSGIPVVMGISQTPEELKGYLALASRLVEKKVNPHLALHYGIPAVARFSKTAEKRKELERKLESLVTTLLDHKVDPVATLFLGIPTVVGVAKTEAAFTIYLDAATRLAQKGISPHLFLQYDIPAAAGIAQTPDDLKEMVEMLETFVANLAGKRADVNEVVHYGIPAVVEIARTPAQLKELLDMFEAFVLKLVEEQADLNPILEEIVPHMARLAKTPDEFKEALGSLETLITRFVETKAQRPYVLEHDIFKAVRVAKTLDAVKEFLSLATRLLEQGIDPHYVLEDSIPAVAGDARTAEELRTDLRFLEVVSLKTEGRFLGTHASSVVPLIHDLTHMQESAGGFNIQFAPRTIHFAVKEKGAPGVTEMIEDREQKFEIVPGTIRVTPAGIEGMTGRSEIRRLEGLSDGNINAGIVEALQEDALGDGTMDGKARLQAQQHVAELRGILRGAETDLALEQEIEASWRILGHGDHARSGNARSEIRERLEQVFRAFGINEGSGKTRLEETKNKADRWYIEGMTRQHMNPRGKGAINKNGPYAPLQIRNEKGALNEITNEGNAVVTAMLEDSELQAAGVFQRSFLDNHPRKKEYLAAAAKASLIWNTLDGGIGESLMREAWLLNKGLRARLKDILAAGDKAEPQYRGAMAMLLKAEEEGETTDILAVLRELEDLAGFTEPLQVKMGAKGTDLGRLEQIRGKEYFVGDAEARLLFMADLAESKQFGKVLFQPLVNDQSMESYHQLLKRTYLWDVIEGRPNPRTYQEALEEAGVGIMQMVEQRNLPKFEVPLGEKVGFPTTDDKDERKQQPGGHGQLGVYFVVDFTENAPTKDGLHHIRFFANGDNRKGNPEAIVAGFAIAERLPILKITTPATAIDKKGGKEVIRIIQMVINAMKRILNVLDQWEEIDAINAGQQKIFYAAGQRHGFGKEGKQLFNTNLFYFNIDMLHPILNEMRHIVGPDRFLDGIMPFLFDKSAKAMEIDGKTYVSMDSAIGYVLHKLNTFYMTDPRFEHLRKEYGPQLLYYMNYDRDIFAPKKKAEDQYLQEGTDYYSPFDETIKNFRDAVPGLTPPGFDLRDPIVKDGKESDTKFWTEAQHWLDSLGFSRIRRMTSLKAEGRFTLRNAEYIGDVEIINRYGRANKTDHAKRVVLSSGPYLDELKKRGYWDGDHVVLENVQITIDESGRLLAMPIATAKTPDGALRIRDIDTAKALFVEMGAQGAHVHVGQGLKIVNGGELIISRMEFGPGTTLFLGDHVVIDGVTVNLRLGGRNVVIVDSDTTFKGPAGLQLDLKLKESAWLHADPATLTDVIEKLSQVPGEGRLEVLQSYRARVERQSLDKAFFIRKLVESLAANPTEDPVLFENARWAKQEIDNFESTRRSEVRGGQAQENLLTEQALEEAIQRSEQEIATLLTSIAEARTVQAQRLVPGYEGRIRETQQVIALYQQQLLAAAIPNPEVLKRLLAVASPQTLYEIYQAVKAVLPANGTIQPQEMLLFFFGIPAQGQETEMRESVAALGNFLAQRPGATPAGSLQALQTARQALIHLYPFQLLKFVIEQLSLASVESRLEVLQFYRARVEKRAMEEASFIRKLVEFLAANPIEEPVLLENARWAKQEIDNFESTRRSEIRSGKAQEMSTEQALEEAIQRNEQEIAMLRRSIAEARTVQAQRLVPGYEGRIRETQQVIALYQQQLLAAAIPNPEVLKRLLSVASPQTLYEIYQAVKAVLPANGTIQPQEMLLFFFGIPAQGQETEMRESVAALGNFLAQRPGAISAGSLQALQTARQALIHLYPFQFLTLLQIANRLQRETVLQVLNRTAHPAAAEQRQSPGQGVNTAREVSSFPQTGTPVLFLAAFLRNLGAVTGHATAFSSENLIAEASELSRIVPGVAFAAPEIYQAAEAVLPTQGKIQPQEMLRFFYGIPAQGQEKAMREYVEALGNFLAQRPGGIPAGSLRALQIARQALIRFYPFQFLTLSQMANRLQRETVLQVLRGTAVVGAAEQRQSPGQGINAAREVSSFSQSGLQTLFLAAFLRNLGAVTGHATAFSSENLIAEASELSRIVPGTAPAVSGVVSAAAVTSLSPESRRSEVRANEFRFRAVPVANSGERGTTSWNVSIQSENGRFIGSFIIPVSQGAGEQTLVVNFLDEEGRAPAFLKTVSFKIALSKRGNVKEVSTAGVHIGFPQNTTTATASEERQTAIAQAKAFGSAFKVFLESKIGQRWSVELFRASPRIKGGQTFQGGVKFEMMDESFAPPEIRWSAQELQGLSPETAGALEYWTPVLYTFRAVDVERARGIREGLRPQQGSYELRVAAHLLKKIATQLTRSKIESLTGTEMDFAETGAVLRAAVRDGRSLLRSGGVSREVNRYDQLEKLANSTKLLKILLIKLKETYGNGVPGAQVFPQEPVPHRSELRRAQILEALATPEVLQLIKQYYFRIVPMRFYREIVETGGRETLLQALQQFAGVPVGFAAEGAAGTDALGALFPSEAPLGIPEASGGMAVADGASVQSFANPGAVFLGQDMLRKLVEENPRALFYLLKEYAALAQDKAPVLMTIGSPEILPQIRLALINRNSGLKGLEISERDALLPALEAGKILKVIEPAQGVSETQAINEVAAATRGGIASLHLNAAMLPGLAEGVHFAFGENIGARDLMVASVLAIVLKSAADLIHNVPDANIRAELLNKFILENLPGVRPQQQGRNAFVITQIARLALEFVAQARIATMA